MANVRAKHALRSLGKAGPDHVLSRRGYHTRLVRVEMTGKNVGHAVCYVDDEAKIRELLTGFLTAKGYRVTTAASVHEAVRKAQADPPNLLVSDLQLEDGDGFEIITRIKRDRPDLPVILLTGVLFDEEVVDKVIRELVTCYLEKTPPLTKIGDAIKSLLPTEPAA
ncbi:MAG: response regulator [Cephaloticoccus sp.]